jgi:hypothetical protein
MVSGRISFAVLRIKRFRGFDDSLESHENMIYRSTFFFTLLLMFTCPPRSNLKPRHPLTELQAKRICRSFLVSWCSLIPDVPQRCFLMIFTLIPFAMVLAVSLLVPNDFLVRNTSRNTMASRIEHIAIEFKLKCIVQLRQHFVHYVSITCDFYLRCALTVVA